MQIKAVTAILMHTHHSFRKTTLFNTKIMISNLKRIKTHFKRIFCPKVVKKAQTIKFNRF